MIPRGEFNWYPDYLREQALKALDVPEAAEDAGAGEQDVALALLYTHAAISLEPFNGDNYAGLAAMYLGLEETDTAIRWLNEGLFIDTENEALNALLESMKGVLEQ